MFSVDRTRELSKSSFSCSSLRVVCFVNEGAQSSWQPTQVSIITTCIKLHMSVYTRPGFVDLPSVHFLPAADKIISIGMDGKIVEQGSYEELKDEQGYVSSLDITRRPHPSAFANVQKEHGFSSSKFEIQGKMPEVISTEAKRRLGDAALYPYLIRAYGKANFFVYLFFQVGWAAMTNLPSKSSCPLSVVLFIHATVSATLTNVIALWLQWWSNSIANGEPRNIHFLGGYAGIQGAFLVALLLSAS